MKGLDEMIKELCPDGVEFVKLGECCNFVNGFAFKSSKFKEKGDTIIRITNINGTGVDVNDVKYFNKSDYKANWQTFEIHKGDILIAMSGATTGKVGIYNNKTIAYLNQRVGKIVPDKSKLVNRFLYHILLSKNQFLYMLAGGGAQPNLSSTKLMNVFEIPLPPIEVQTEIVRILDKFTSLEAELEAELKAEQDFRKRQYEYYRDKLLSFDNVGGQEVEWKKMSEVCEIYDGTHQTPKYQSGGIPFISVENIKDIYGSNKYISLEDYESYKIKPKVGDVFMTRIGSIGVCTVFTKQADIAYYVSLALLRPNKEILDSRYLKHFIESAIGRKELGKRILHNAVPIKINKSDIGKVKLLIPSLEEQHRIVSILDRFESLTTSLQSGLPAEISARRQQYEYYRDKLLTFKRKGAV